MPMTSELPYRVLWKVVCKETETEEEKDELLEPSKQFTLLSYKTRKRH